MLATPLAVNAEGVSFTETISPEQAKRGASLKALVSTVDERGKTGHLAASVGPLIGLDDKAPIKYLELLPNAPQWTTRYCDLVYGQTDTKLPPHPQCFVMIEKVKNGQDVLYKNFRFDLTGRLIGASQTTGKMTDDGQPIRASGKMDKLDVTDPKVKKEADALMDFWRLGHYKKYLAPTAAPAKK